MNRIQLLIFNQQIYDVFVGNTKTVKQLFDTQQELVAFSLQSLKEIDANNEVTDKKTISLEQKFSEFQIIDAKYYDDFLINSSKYLQKLENNLLSEATFKRLPLLLKSLFVTYNVVNNIEVSEKKVLINEIIEISKLYLEPKFVKMLNKVIDDFGN